MFACQKAVELAPNNERYRDSRGVARALTGDTQGAIEDFEEYLKFADHSDQRTAQRQRWIDALKQGENPFTEEEIKGLINE